MASNYLSPPQAADLLGVNTDRLRGWIRSGELLAVNVADSKNRPRWRISQVELDNFLARRSNATTVKPPKVRRPKLGEVKQWV